ncbi:SPOR domain-containing protein [Candidatus Odyssella thessalonicensis]|uniref:SPOR domain-containing protein n=1 Tax=Candidatus Odyssella thessalonicensis TaxID=84647 RepID=UPI000225BAE9|nr:SPOR domain-containing protein [Candidatus Odyssella thessalonicensis]
MTPFFRKLQESEERSEARLRSKEQQWGSAYSEDEPRDIRLGEVRATFGQVERDDQIHRLKFMHNNERLSEASSEDWDERHSPLNFIILASLIIILVVLAWFGYRWFNNSYNEAPPVLMADESPYKVRPEHPGGISIPHQDKLIYGRITPQSQATPERLLPQPEQPVLPEYQQHYTQPAYGSPNNGYPSQDPQQQLQSSPSYAEVSPSQQTYHPAPTIGPEQHAYAPQQPIMSPQSQEYVPQAYPQQAYPNQGYNPQPVPQYQPTAPQVAQSHDQGNPYGNQYGPAPVNDARPEMNYANAAYMPAQAPQQMLKPRPSVHQESVMEVKSESVKVQNTAEPVRDALDELVSSEANMVEKIGSTKLKLASLNNDSPFASPSSAGRGAKKDSPKALVGEGPYRVQLGSFSTEKEAKNEVRRLKGLDHSVFTGKKFIIQKSSSSVTGNAVYKVMVGFFPTANTATTFKNRMKIHRLNGIVIKSAA